MADDGGSVELPTGTPAMASAQGSAGDGLTFRQLLIITPCVCAKLPERELKGDVMSVVKIIEVVGRSTTSSDDAVKSALSEAQRSLRDVKAVDVVSVGLRGDNLDEWGALVRISFLVESVTD